MHGIWLENSRIVYRQDLTKPQPVAYEALIRTRLAGICGTDTQLLKGYADFTGVPGHEFVGVVEACPSNPEWVGKRVVGEINIACGHCAYCDKNLGEHCKSRRVLGIRNYHGAFAEYFTLPVANLHQVPDAVSDEDAVFTEPLAAALRITEQVDIDSATNVLIVGAGKLGQLIALALKQKTDLVTVVIRHPQQQLLLTENNINVVTDDQIQDHQYDVVVEASGSPSGLELAIKSVKPLGTIVLKSTYSQKASIDLSSVVVDEITVVGSRCGPFEAAIKCLSSTAIQPSKLIEHIYPAIQSQQAFQHAQQRGARKILLSFA